MTTTRQLVTTEVRSRCGHKRAIYHDRPDRGDFVCRCFTVGGGHPGRGHLRLTAWGDRESCALLAEAWCASGEQEALR